MPLTLNEAIEVVTKGYPIQYANNIMNTCSFCEQDKSTHFFVYNNKEVCKSCSIIVNNLKEKINDPIPTENNKESIKHVFGTFVKNPININNFEQLIYKRINKRSMENPQIEEITSNSSIDHFFNPILDNKESELDNYFQLNNNNDNLFSWKLNIFTNL